MIIAFFILDDFVYKDTTFLNNRVFINMFESIALKWFLKD